MDRDFKVSTDLGQGPHPKSKKVPPTKKIKKKTKRAKTSTSISRLFEPPNTMPNGLMDVLILKSTDAERKELRSSKWPGKQLCEVQNIMPKTMDSFWKSASDSHVQKIVDAIVSCNFRTDFFGDTSTVELLFLLPNILQRDRMHPALQLKELILLANTDTDKEYDYLDAKSIKSFHSNAQVGVKS